MPKERPNALSSDVLDAAIELVEAKYLRSDQDLRQLDEFCACSEAHAEAVRRAERYVLIARKAKQRSRSRWRRYRLYFEVWWERLLEYRRLAYAASVGVVLLAAGSLYSLLAPTEVPLATTTTTPVVEPGLAQQYRTRWRQQREITLSDGSIVWLGWNTELHVRLATQQRVVSLHGGIAAFRVAPDSARPFFVNAGGSQTEVTGTEFVVNYQQADRVEIAVLEGQVRVTTDQDTARLDAQQVVVASDRALGRVAHRSQAEIGRWREGMLVFDQRPVLEALAVLEPYTRYRIDASGLLDTSGRVSGVFYTDRADDALLMLLQTHRLEYEQRDGNTLRLRNERPDFPRPGRPYHP